ncbi:hypothetical protein [Bacilliculturomica massiliensis]|uniref:hypothetical protein n=1 Tax=Bacilliculturomica massiliensis TaxID=1917867 RepID=UPI001031D471|nr:hypothetical protein [Bacilliculturomica massiliensis]
MMKQSGDLMVIKEGAMELRTRLHKKTAAQLVLLSALPFYILILVTIYRNQLSGHGSHGNMVLAVFTVIFGGLFFAFLLGAALVRPAWMVLTGSRYQGMEWVERYFSDRELEALLRDEHFHPVNGRLSQSEKWIRIDGIFVPRNMIADWQTVTALPNGDGWAREIRLLLTDGRACTLTESGDGPVSACASGLMRAVRPLRPGLLRRLNDAELQAARRSLKQEFLADLESDRHFLFDRPLPLTVPGPEAGVSS